MECQLKSNLNAVLRKLLDKVVEAEGHVTLRHHDVFQQKSLVVVEVC